jgi:hypothetical protein
MVELLLEGCLLALIVTSWHRSRHLTE